MKLRLVNFEAAAVSTDGGLDAINGYWGQLLLTSREEKVDLRVAAVIEARTAELDSIPDLRVTLRNASDDVLAEVRGEPSIRRLEGGVSPQLVRDVSLLPTLTLRLEPGLHAWVGELDGVMHDTLEFEVMVPEGGEV